MNEKIEISIFCSANSYCIYSRQSTEDFLGDSRHSAKSKLAFYEQNTLDDSSNIAISRISTCNHEV